MTRFYEVLPLMMENPKRRFKRLAWGPRDFVWYIPEREILASKWLGPKECIQKRDVMDDDGTTITEHYVVLRAHMCRYVDSATMYYTPDVMDIAADDWYEVTS